MLILVINEVPMESQERYGGASPPKPPERGTPRGEFLAYATTHCTLFSKTDERYGFVKIPRGARVWGILSF